MADLNFQQGLAHNGAFSSRVNAALINAALAILTETVNEVQTLSITGGTPVSGSFSLGSLPGSQTINQSGNTHTTTTIDSLSSTVGLFVGMSVTGSGIPAGATIATITSNTAITISAAATSTLTATPLVFSGTPLVTVAFNATYADVQSALQSLSPIGVGNVICAGGPLPGTPITITFCGGLGGTPQKLITISGSTLSVGTASVARTTPGVGAVIHAQRAAQAARILYGSIDIFRYALAVAGDATTAADFDANFNPSATETKIATDIANAVSANFNAFN